MTRLESDYYAYMGYDRDHSRAGLSHYVPYFPDGPVLELACGRGEFLELLREAGVPAQGVDLDEGMVEAARAAGLEVAYGDALADLAGRPAGSLGGVFSAHFVEHLQPEAVEQLVADAARALRPGGVFVAATPNAGCVSVIGHDFWRDPTHVRPYEPRLLAFYCAKAGMEVVEIGGNPRNHAGPPPEALAPPTHVDADLRGDLANAINRINDPGGVGVSLEGSPWALFGHFIAVLEERLRTTQEELAAVRRSYAHLLDRLYPSNEVYVVARAV
ncbi:MAG: class SAM-dependent methyltransferase [Frankiales bacterium]|jgi:SAM-dependent methyltransferase|nr:class SAM-dependent methyltransferase [Frankiales bacterium]